jgi:galactonate dehydratase
MNATGPSDWLDSPSTLDSAVSRLRTVKELGMDAALDFHGRLHKPMALQLAAKLAPLDPLFLEEPLLSQHPTAIAAIASHVNTPIALGERLHSRWDFVPFLGGGRSGDGGVSIFQPDVAHCGGISEMVRIASLAETFDIGLAPHCPLGPVALAASVQVDAAVANFAIQEMGLGIHYNTAFEGGAFDITSYIKDPNVWNVERGFIDVPTGSGLGVDIDEEFVRRVAGIEGSVKSWRSPEFVGIDGGLREW